jgi:3-hydroxyisobutyrate dehydrogenase-like beta-hydroxyacid dehydrogenase
VLVLLAAAIGILIAQLVLDAPVIQTRVGAAAETPALMYGGTRG